MEANAGDNVLNDDLDNHMIANKNFYDEVDMANIYNINFEEDDTYVELDELEEY